MSQDQVDEIVSAIKAIDTKIDRIEGRLSRLESIQNALARHALDVDQTNALGITSTRDSAMPRDFSALGVDTQKVRDRTSRTADTRAWDSVGTRVQG